MTTRLRGIRAARSVALLAVLAWQFPIGAQPSADESVTLGKRIYREGMLPSGKPVRALVQGDVELEGTELNCASCHRWSGFGSSEGGALVPAIAAPILFQPTRYRRADLFRSLYEEVQSKPVQSRVRAGRHRPAYTEETLDGAIRRGIDSAGRPLDPLMPRYQLDDQDAAHLLAYLRTLSVADSEGVDGQKIHFATVITSPVDPAQKKAVLDVMRAYVNRKNEDTRAQLARPGHSLWHRDDFYETYRIWEMHVWQLEGPPTLWRQQLEDLYRRQPVFALLGGLSRDSWQPVQDFCEDREIPVVFPNTLLPPDSPGSYSLYFSRGLGLEGEGLARYLSQDNLSRSRPVQIHRKGSRGEVAARALRSWLEKDGRFVQDLEMPAATDLGDAIQSRNALDSPSAVLWLEESDLEKLAALPGIEAWERIYLSFDLAPGFRAFWPQRLWSRTRLTYGYALSDEAIPRSYRVRAWMRSRGIEQTHPRLQLNAYFALSVADSALMHMVDHFSRDYFIEYIEHETENWLNPGVYPRLSLGPGQRFASKGIYIARLTSDGEIQAASDWIVP